MNRRTLFKRLTAVAAAAALAPAVQPAEASEAELMDPQTWDWEGAVRVSPAAPLLTVSSNATITGPLVIRSAGVVPTEASEMQSAAQYAKAVNDGMDAAERATRTSGEQWLFVPEGYVTMREETTALKILNRERHQMAALTDAALSDARAEGYRAGWETATLRAENRAQFLASFAQGLTPTVKDA